jgi:murein DD-endopeptidase MepM/ murein hydrolase activator NlpD
VIVRHTTLLLLLSLGLAASADAQVNRPMQAPRQSAREVPPVIPALPDTTGFGVPILAITRAPDSSLWVGTYGRGIYVLRAGDSTWRHIANDTTGRSISFNWVHAFAFPRPGVIWYGTPGNGWGMSTDGGATWRNWTGDQLGAEFQYTTPDGIGVRGNSVYIATADGVMITHDDGESWEALVDTVGPQVTRLTSRVTPILRNEYVKRILVDRRGIVVRTLRGIQRLTPVGDRWTSEPERIVAFRPLNSTQIGRWQLKGSNCGIQIRGFELPCYSTSRAVTVGEGAFPRTAWFRRPIGIDDQPYVDQTYRYGSTFGGTFQPHQGVEFNNPDGTPVRAIANGRVVWAGPAERGALTVAIRHDTTVTGVVPRSPADSAAAVRARLFIYSVYYHNSTLRVKEGDRVRAGDVISHVGNTGRATNDHLHLEVHTTPIDSVQLVVDPNNRYPRYTVNPELWLQPLQSEGEAASGWVAGQVWDGAGRAVPQAKIFGLWKFEPAETPMVMIETHGPRNHMHPLYQEHFAVGDVPPGDHWMGVEIDGRRIYRKVTVTAGRVSWVVFRP